MKKDFLPQEFLGRLKDQFGDSTSRAIQKAFEADRPVTLRVNQLKAEDANVVNEMRRLGFLIEKIPGVLHAFRVRNADERALFDTGLVQQGFVYLQSLSSMLPPIVLDPKPGDKILDLCAAPGSKTSELAALTQNQAQITALEVDKIRYEKLLATLDRQGAEAKTIFGDATVIPKSMPGQFDKILADVPCSAEGRISLLEPRSYRFWSLKNITEHAKLQRRLLRAAHESLKSGGTLVYSTCTLAKEENEDMVKWFLETYPDMRSAPVSLGFRKIVEHGNFGLTILPDDLTEGFFIAKLKKV